jgi:hypothetical protein
VSVRVLIISEDALPRDVMEVTKTPSSELDSTNMGIEERSIYRMIESRWRKRAGSGIRSYSLNELVGEDMYVGR